MQLISTNEVREQYQKFFQERQHVRLPSAPLVPENDPTTLFTGSGMQPLLPYLLGQPHPLGSRLVNSQKSLRVQDIEEVGDNRHTTFFEMLGNWSLGSYFKEQQLPWIFEFLTQELGIKPARLYVTVFSGDEHLGVPRDEESAQIWRRLFSDQNIGNETVDLITSSRASQIGMGKGRIFFFDASKNWWSRSGQPEAMPLGEPGGPDSEIFYDFGIPHNPAFGKHCHPNCDCGRFMEIGNSVFMEYVKQNDGSFTPLPQKNVDFGGGLERITAAANNTSDIFLVDVFQTILDAFSKAYSLQYNGADERVRRSMRIVVDHIRAATFIASEGIEPHKKDQGYILRRLIRRAIFNIDTLVRGASSVWPIVDSVIEAYAAPYPELILKRDLIHKIIEEEEFRFIKTLKRGMRKFEQLIQDNHDISGQDTFELYTSYGFPKELTVELARQRGASVDELSFDQFFLTHQRSSAQAARGKFAGGLSDHSEMSVKYHTATHLLHQALQDVLGEHAVQRGSNITPERLRFDFSHPDKMTAEQIKKVEEIVNEKIAQDLPVKRSEMTVEEAREKGALGLFGHKYAEKVSVYQVGDYSIEICGGPHVEHTGVLGKFKITKEESAGGGIRRIKAILE